MVVGGTRWVDGRKRKRVGGMVGGRENRRAGRENVMGGLGGQVGERGRGDWGG